MLERALEGLTVLDMSRILAGPWCTQNLADLGADVIKVENPNGGDDTRSWGPPYPEGTGPEHGFSSYFAAANRGKRSLTVNFADPAGLEILTRLAAESDILVENYKAGTLARYGLGYDELKKVNPRLIYCSITGYGQTGPMAHKPGYDFVFQGTGGLMSYTGQPDGRPGAEPLRCGISLMDLSSGLYATSAILAAVIQRATTGEGQFIDFALLDASVAINANMAQTYLMTGVPPQRFGNAHPTIAPYEVFATTDGFMILAIGNDSQFAKFCDVAGRPEIAADDRYRIPVMGHVGLTPQTATALGGFKAQGRTAEGARRIAHEARALQAAGCFCVVLEAIPAELTEQLMPSLDSSLVIGIGAGPATDGQVLVLHDMVGLGSGGAAKFVKRYAELHDPLVEAVRTYADEVRERAYPAPEHTYTMPAGERERLDLR